MKKMIFSAAAFALVAVSSIALNPTTAEAVPAFARQTGAACLSCHFQEIPALTAFGRSFKMNAFTDMGTQELVEDDGLSIPAALNATVVIRPQVTQTKTISAGTAAVAAVPATPGNVGTASVPAVAAGTVTTTKSISYGDQVVLIGGRIGTNSGAFVELGGGAFGNHQFMNSFDFGGFKAGINYANSGFGETAGLGLTNVWGQHGGTNNARFTSANHQMFKGIPGALGGGQIAALVGWVGNDMGAIQAGLVAPSTDATTWGAGGNSTFTAAKMVAANGFFDVGGMSLGVGGILVGGNVGANAQFVGNQLTMERTGIDVQLEGEIGHAGFGIYADMANAKKSTAAETNAYNASTTNNLKGWSVRAQVEPIHGLLLTAGTGTLQAGTKTERVHFGASYSVYQNFVIALRQENSKTKSAAGATGRVKTTTLDIEALM